MSELHFVSAAASLLGPREYQNDAYSTNRLVVVLADGAGAGADARQAADFVVNHYASFDDITSDGVIEGLLDAPRSIGAQLQGVECVAGSTAAAAVLDGSARLWLSTLGDSRIVVVRQGRIVHLSRLHNRAAALRESEPTAVVPPGAASSLTRMIASGRDDVPDVSVLTAREGDQVILLSDGADSKVSPLQAAKFALGDRRGRAARMIVDAASEQGLSDNATCVVAEIWRTLPATEQ
ncbi:hypothetical protein B7R54_17410 [Subtercola boreus]|uniref:PPM-type phosphatase domain-containing protein n=1 Tax=Subtercola boreus TaxID=120213 RepID=A0A3E0VLB9_9MICO|nr:protein phosphatase 2C domain-containing protein [Subtercola boreus]RFA10784.1 hypothetical protein B7R54_17410 [Subtercola boreus]TQL55642.1 serine/threonine protein phosphatase PrpC [Subtercola boreus]